MKRFRIQTVITVIKSFELRYKSFSSAKKKRKTEQAIKASKVNEHKGENNLLGREIISDN